MAFRVLFLCTGNSARSVLAEATLEALGAPRFAAASAGSHPAGAVHPAALDQLRARGFGTDGLRSKSWDEFAAPGSAPFELVVTVCDHAAGEACPAFPGDFTRVHWSLPDPAAVDGDARARAEAFARTHRVLLARLQALVAEPVETMDRAALTAAMQRIERRYPPLPLT
ncbi:MAG TPA: arsenate reductase ArsC [Xanthomonadaceae bacterium]|nr:arsenate reductase ArsC [Xanthomonadaceae bacterium]